MNKNQIFIKSGTEYEKMTKELLTASNLAELIGDRHKMVGINRIWCRHPIRLRAAPHIRKS